MQEFEMTNVDVNEFDELAPVTLGQVSEVTGAAPDGEHDWDNVVWGNE